MKAAAVTIFSAAGVLAAPRLPGTTLRTRNPGSYSGNGDNHWAGAVQEGKGWNYVSGTTKLPSITGQGHSAGASGWVGIDGWSCQSTILQTGVQAYGDGTYRAWYEWHPELPVYYSAAEFAVKTGDEVRLSVTATSSTSGSSTLENLTTGQTITTPYTGKQQLCQADAEWVIEFSGDAESLVNFSSWSIYNTVAKDGGQDITAAGGTISEISLGGVTKTSCSTTSSGQVDCSYVG